MPKSTPFGFENMVTFYDQATKTLELYYTKGHSNDEIKACFQQFEADYTEDLLWCQGHVLEWHVDNITVSLCPTVMDEVYRRNRKRGKPRLCHGTHR